nr:Chain P, 9-meric peptide from Tegument protein pp65 [Human betaherpesvirus 5]
NLVPMGATV